LIVGVLQLRQASGSGRAVAPHVRREQQAIDRLHTYLGRQGSLRRMGDPATQALALRVHPATDLPTVSTVGVSKPVDPQVAGWWRLLPGGWSGRAHRTPSLDRDLPTFVDRDKGPEVCDWLRAARDHGGFLVLIGNSSVGKTRLLYETAREVLADFAVLAPDLGDGDLINQLAGATFPLPKLLVWLDELQRFLDGPYRTPGSTPITAATIRRLLDAPTPVVIVGTLWPEYATELRATDPVPGTTQLRPRYPNAVDILDDRRLHEVVLRTFSIGERQAAARLAADDPRLATALADRDYNVTEILAGAGELVRRYERATHDQQAVLHAAVDARRLGIGAPLTDWLLCAAARGYLTSVQRDDTWFGPVLAELTSARRPQDRATAPLLPMSTADRRRILGYTVADYLLQRLTRRRRTIRVPAVTWQALISHTSDHDDLARLADNAANRLLYGYATPLYRRLADAGDKDAARHLAWRLVEQGRVDELRARADAGDHQAAWRLAELLVEQGRVDELRARADAGDQDAAWRLAELLIEQGRDDELRARADAGDDGAWLLVSELAQHGDVDEAIGVLHAMAYAGDNVAWSLAKLLVEQGSVDDVIKALRTVNDIDASYAAQQLVDLLFQQGRDDDAIEVLHAMADTGDEVAADQLADLLANQLVEQGRVDELRARADAGERKAAWRLAELLVEQGRVDELRARADAGDYDAAWRLADLLVEWGRDDELRARADAGDRIAARRLASLLVKQGDVDEAMEVLRDLADAGDGDAAQRLASLLVKQGDVDEAMEVLRDLADAGDGDAAQQLVRLLVEEGRIDELRAEVDAGTLTAAPRLVALIEHGQLEEAQQMRQRGLNPDGSIAAAGTSPASEIHGVPTHSGHWRSLSDLSTAVGRAASGDMESRRTTSEIHQADISGVPKSDSSPCPVATSAHQIASSSLPKFPHTCLVDLNRCTTKKSPRPITSQCASVRPLSRPTLDP
jgi:tetratricopeptide (TPR) repeat protein